MKKPLEFEDVELNVPIDELVGERFALEAVIDAYVRLTAGGVGRSVVVVPW